MNARREPKIELPAPSADQPPWAKVGLVAVVGFVVGVAWPRVVGLQLGPAPPHDHGTTPAASKDKDKAPEVEVKGGAKPPAMAGTVPASPVGGGSGDGKAAANVSPLEIQKCRDAKGKAVDKCDEIALDPLFVPRLKDLSKCPSAIGLTGKVQIGFDLDFKHKTIKVQRAKAKLPRTTIDGLTKCAEKDLSGISLDDLTHEQQRYTAAYTVDLGPEKAAEPPKEQPKPDEPAGDPKSAEVVWRSTQVRDAPKTGKVVGKLTKGAKVKMLDQKDGWFRVEFGDPKREGWLFREAIGQ